MKAILLCAGYATRLRPLTSNCPKHLLEVGGRPILNHVIDRIAALPLEGIYVVTNHTFFSHFAQWQKERYTLSVPLTVIDDGTSSNTDRLGSIGDLDFVIRGSGIDDETLVFNADNLFTFDLVPMYEAAKERKNLIACYDVREAAEARKMGIPTINEEGRVVGFVEKPKTPSSTEVSIGIYFYSREGTALVRRYVEELAAEGKCPDRTGDFVAWIADRIPVYTYTFGGAGDHWVDIGTPEQYEAAKNSSLFR